MCGFLPSKEGDKATLHQINNTTYDFSMTKESMEEF